MRHFKFLFLACMMSLLSIGANAQNEGTFDWTNVMNAIIQVESKGNEKAFNPNGNCAGILQITPILVRECNQILAAKKSTKRFTYQDRFNAEKSKEMFIIFQEHHNPSHDVETAIRMWNGGPYYKRASTDGYYRRVMKHLK